MACPKDFDALLALAGSQAACGVDTKAGNSEKSSAAAASKRTLQRLTINRGIVQWRRVALPKLHQGGTTAPLVQARSCFVA